jgi:hypothetical protein
MRLLSHNYNGNGNAAMAWVILLLDITQLRLCWWTSGFLIPTGQAEPVGSCTGLPVWFVRKPVETGEIQISNQNLSSIGSHRYTDRYTGSFKQKNELVENLTCFQI